MMTSNNISPSGASSGEKGCNSNLQTHRGRRLHTIKITAVSMVAVVSLIVFVTIDVQKSRLHISKMEIIKTKVELNFHTAGLIHSLQTERGITVLYHSSNQDPSVLSRLEAIQKDTSTILESLEVWPEANSDTELDHMSSKNKFMHHLDEYRSRVDGNQTVDDVIVFYSSIIKSMLSWLTDVTVQINDAIAMLLGYEFVLRAKEFASLKRAYGAQFYIHGHFNSFQLKDFYGAKMLSEVYLNKSYVFIPSLEETFNQQLNSFSTVKEDLQKMENKIIANEFIYPSVSNATEWFNLMSEFLDALLMVQNSVAEILLSDIASSIETRTTKIITLLVLVVIVILFIPLLTSSLLQTTKIIRSYVYKTTKQQFELFEQKKRADNLVEDYMPRSVAAIIEKEGKYNSKEIESVTIAFIDIAHFDDIIVQCEPESIPEIFIAIDEILAECARRYNVYKMNAAHTSWMVISGAPELNGIRHVDEVAQFSLDIQEYVKELKLAGRHISLRVGMHTGTVITGVCGGDTPKYCVLGKTVRLASSIMKYGLGHKVLVSEDTKYLLDNLGCYFTGFNAVLKAKDKDPLRTYWLLGRTYKYSLRH